MPEEYCASPHARPQDWIEDHHTISWHNKSMSVLF